MKTSTPFSAKCLVPVSKANAAKGRPAKIRLIILERNGAYNRAMRSIHSVFVHSMRVPGKTIQSWVACCSLLKLGWTVGNERRYSGHQINTDPCFMQCGEISMQLQRIMHNFLQTSVLKKIFDAFIPNCLVFH